jgi:hypothetical protein
MAVPDAFCWSLAICAATSSSGCSCNCCSLSLAFCATGVHGSRSAYSNPSAAAVGSICITELATQQGVKTDSEWDAEQYCMCIHLVMHTAACVSWRTAGWHQTAQLQLLQWA